MDDVCRLVRGDFHVYGVAGGIAVSGIAAEFLVAGIEERFGGMVDSVGTVRIRTYHEYGISELAVCNFGEHRWIVLWLDMEEDGIDFCVGAGACGSGRGVAFLLPGDVKSTRPVESC